MKMEIVEMILGKDKFVKNLLKFLKKAKGKAFISISIKSIPIHNLFIINVIVNFNRLYEYINCADIFGMIELH